MTSLFSRPAGRASKRGGDDRQNCSRRPISATGSRRRSLIALTLVVGGWWAAPVTPAAAQEDGSGGDGRYELSARLFGTPEDGLVGQTTSSGHRLGVDDRLVGLPACTISSCPWLPPGSGAGGAWGAQTSCAEGDGLCWVELTDPRTGTCVSAPVLDLGPGFVRDNWWAAMEERTYPLPRGNPAAVRAAQGVDLGYGPGRSDAGYDATTWETPPALHVSAGAWADLGLDPSQPSAALGVRLLWQAEIFRSEACDGASAPGSNATTTESVNLRSAPGGEGAVVAVLPPGVRVGITGAEERGYAPVGHGGRRGWVAADFLLRDEAQAATLTADVNLRAEPSVQGAIVGILSTGTGVTPTGPERDGYLPVIADEVEGWVAAPFVRYG